MVHHRKTLLRTSAVLAVGALALVGCSSTTESTVPEDCTPEHDGLTTYTEGTLSVGVPENLPYTQTTDGGGAGGLEIEVVELLAEAECLAVSYVPITYGNGIPMISEQQQADMITGGWYVTPERAEQVGFTSPTFYDSMGIISADGATTVEELESIGQVGSGAGFSWEADMSEILGSNMVSYPGTIEMRQDLENGRIDAALDGYAVATVAYADTEFQVEVAEPDDRVAITTDMPMIAFPIAQENTDLSDAFSELIDGYREDGTLTDLLAEYDLPEDLLIPADAAADSIR